MRGAGGCAGWLARTCPGLRGRLGVRDVLNCGTFVFPFFDMSDSSGAAGGADKLRGFRTSVQTALGQCNGVQRKAPPVRCNEWSGAAGRGGAMSGAYTADGDEECHRRNDNQDEEQGEATQGRRGLRRL